jgi:hypothetical protein
MALAAVKGYSGDEPALLSQLRSQVDDARRLRAQRERDWHIQREFYRGQQYAAYIDGRGVVEQMPNLKNKPRLINNMCRSSVDTILAYLLRQDPAMDVVANTGEPEDQNAAMTARSVLYHYWHALNCQEKLQAAGKFALTMCAGFWKIGWDPLKGPKIQEMTQQPVMPSPEIMAAVMAGTTPMPEPELQLVPSGKTYPGGEVRVDVVSPFEFLVDPQAQSLDDAEWVCQHSMRQSAEMQALYPKKKDELEPDKSSPSTGYERSTLANFADGVGKENQTRVEVFEYWHRANAKWPNGFRCLFTKRGIIDSGPTPQGYDEIPFAMWADKTVPGEFWPDATLKDAIPLQKEHNKRLSQLVDIANKFKVYWTCLEGEVSEEQITNEDGQVIEFHTPGHEPTPHDPPPVPDSLVKLLEVTREAIENATGATGVLQGNVKGEVRSGRQVAYQGQYAEGRINLSAKGLARFLMRAGKLILQMVAANVDDRRIARVVGKNRSIEVKDFVGADIRGQTDVVVDAGTMLSFSKAERFNMLKEMLQGQVISPQRFLELMDMADFSSALEDIAQDRNNAQRENEDWRQGRPTSKPRPFENHQVHLTNHNYFRKSDAYRMLDPTVMAEVDAHCGFHEQSLVQAAQGMPPSPPASPPGGGEGGAPPEVGKSGAPGQPPPTPADMQAMADAALAQSGQELAEGLPPVPPLADSAGPGSA